MEGYDFGSFVSRAFWSPSHFQNHQAKGKKLHYIYFWRTSPDNTFFQIVNYEVLHYPSSHHVEHIEHLPHHLEHHVEHSAPYHAEHHVEHVVPHHLEHGVPHHVEHLEHLPHHIEHTEHVHVENGGWEPSAPWSRSGAGNDAQEIAYSGQRK